MISDNDLLLYHYRDGLDADERARIGAALKAQPELAAHLQALLAQLDAAAATPDVTVPPETLQRWQTTLDRAARNEGAANASRPGFFGQMRWWAAAAVASVIVVLAAVKLGFDSTQVDGTRTIPREIASSTPAPLSYERGMQWHLAAAERQLTGFDDASGEERAALIDRVIAQNRMYAIAAERAGDARLARALRSFTPILERLAEPQAGSSDAGGDLAQLNFELRVMQARLATETATPPNARAVAL
jgi:hypothetical protein